MANRPVIIDCDTGIDDAMALVIATNARNIDILAVTTVAGNTTVENVVRNTCNVLHYLKRDDIPVAKGADKPSERQLKVAAYVHGKTGLRGWDFDEDYCDNLSPLSAVDLMAGKIRSSKEKVTILALGPVTNIEAFIRKYPELKEKISQIVFMGMSYHSGNPTALSTFNVLVDPEAFRKVIHSGIPFTACPLDTTRKAYLTMDDIEEILSMDTDKARFVSGILSGYGELLPSKHKALERENNEALEMNLEKKKDLKISLHDPTTAAYIVKPELFTGKKYYADVECSGEITTGFTFVDKEDYYKKSDEERNVFFLETVDREGFVKLFKESMKV